MNDRENSCVGVKHITLCGTKGCCPTVDISDKIVITDDLDGKVTLTKTQWQDAVAKVKLE